MAQAARVVIACEKRTGKNFTPADMEGGLLAEYLTDADYQFLDQVSAKTPTAFPSRLGSTQQQSKMLFRKFILQFSKTRVISSSASTEMTRASYSRAHTELSASTTFTHELLPSTELELLTGAA